MTRRTQLRLCGLHQLALGGLRAVHAVAGRARQIAPVMGAAFPRCVIAAVMTGQAGLADFSCRDLTELLDVPFRVVVHVGLTGTVATLAALRRGRSPRILHLCVLCALQRLFFVGVTRHAGVAAGVAWLRRRSRGLTG